MHDWHMGWGGGGIWLGPLWMIVWLALLVAVIVAVVRWLSETGSGARTDQRAARATFSIERYARGEGEIDRDEYMKRKQDVAEN